MTRSLRAASEFAALGQKLRELSDGREFLFFPMHGNWGDSLIRKGATSLFEREGLMARTWYPRDFVSEKFSFRFPPRKRKGIDSTEIARIAHGHDLAVIGGGGGWCPPYSGTRRLAELLLPHCRRIVILPHSFALPQLPGNVVYYSRDDGYSRHSISNAHFCHDMAFFLEPRRRDAFMDEGLFFRGDRESKFQLGRVKGNLDVSRLDDALGDPEGFFDIIGRYAEIVTDRLHVAIAGALLGRTTYVLPGSYWKIKSVFESSFRPNFPNVRFFESPPELPRAIQNRLQLD